MSDSVYTNSKALIRYLLRESDVLRSPVLIFVVIASASRTAMIFLINEIAGQGGPDLWSFLALLAVSITMLATTHWSKMSGVVLVQRLIRKMRGDLTGRLLHADVTFFQERTHGEMFNATTGHVSNVASTTLRLVDIVQAFLLLVFCLIYMAIQMPSSVLATLAALVFGTIAFFATEGPATRAVQKSHDALVAFHDSVHDLLRGYKELRLRRTRREDLSKKIDGQVELAQSLMITTERHYSYGQIGASASLAALLASIVVVLPLIGEIDSVTMLQILTLALFSFGPIESMVGGLPALARAAISFQIIQELEADLDQNAEHPALATDSDNRPSFKTLEMRGITAHLTRKVGSDSKAKDSFTLGPIDLTLYPGQSVFITGGNGMGKSTMLQLLTGLRHADSGQLILDGEVITRETIGAYRGVFAAVFSEFYMFRHIYGLSAEERSRLQAHIEELGIVEGVSIEGDEFTNLSLSTGQMRRLALSIALAEKRPILVLDEFAADQDPARRRFFYDELVPRLAAAGHCVVAVTHDEHCFSKADRLIRMEDGKIVSDTLNDNSAASA